MSISGGTADLQDYLGNLDDFDLRVSCRRSSSTGSPTAVVQPTQKTQPNIAANQSAYLSASNVTSTAWKASEWAPTSYSLIC